MRCEGTRLEPSANSGDSSYVTRESPLSNPSAFDWAVKFWSKLVVHILILAITLPFTLALLKGLGVIELPMGVLLVYGGPPSGAVVLLLIVLRLLFNKFSELK